MTAIHPDWQMWVFSHLFSGAEIWFLRSLLHHFLNLHLILSLSALISLLAASCTPFSLHFSLSHLQTFLYYTSAQFPPASLKFLTLVWLDLNIWLTSNHILTLHFLSLEKFVIHASCFQTMVCIMISYEHIKNSTSSSITVSPQLINMGFLTFIFHCRDLTPETSIVLTPFSLYSLSAPIGLLLASYPLF